VPLDLRLPVGRDLLEGPPLLHSALRRVRPARDRQQTDLAAHDRPARPRDPPAPRRARGPRPYFSSTPYALQSFFTAARRAPLSLLQASRACSSSCSRQAIRVASW